MSQHQPGILKQSNKKHKGSTGKRFQRRQAGSGRVSKLVNTTKSSISSDHKHSSKDSKQMRLNQAKQLKDNKKADIRLQRRLGSNQGPPKIVHVVNMSMSVDSSDVLNHILSDSSMVTELKSSFSSTSIIFTSNIKFRNNFEFIISPTNDLISSINASRTADLILFVTQYSPDYNDMIDEIGHKYLTALKALGTPELVCCVEGLSHVKTNAIHSPIKSIEKFFETKLSLPIRVFDSNNSSMILRHLSSVTIKDISWRSNRTYLLADRVEVMNEPKFKEDKSIPSSSSETVRIGGFIRGSPLFIHTLGHIPGGGTCRLKKVIVLCSGVPFQKRVIDTDNDVIFEADPNQQDSLQMFAVNDQLVGEQTWPSDTELLNNEPGSLEEGRSRRNLPKHIPNGMNDYQADWFLDEEGQFDMQAAQGKPSNNEDGEPLENDWENDNNDDNDELAEGLSVSESMWDGQISSQTLLNDKKLRREANDDKEFADEIDTPQDTSARIRLARYRALQSFRSSPWHPKENLPETYSQIFQFEDFLGTQKRAISELKCVKNLQSMSLLETLSCKKTNTSGSHVIKSRRPSTLSAVDMDIIEIEDKEISDDKMSVHNDFTANLINENKASKFSDSFLTVPGAENYINEGTYVILELDGLSVSAIEELHRRSVVTWFSLLRHENKLSVLNFNIKRVNDDDEDPENITPIKSKQELVFMAGFRTFNSKPIYSEANLNCDKSKLERFLLPGRFSIATVFGPISYQPCPLLVFMKEEDGTLKLIATGSLNSINPDRIVLKKVILTGMPIRVKKKFAVVKHLFYDPQDVRWFKPAELVTKCGLRGRIREPVGTHGLFKAGFSAPIKQNDTVMLVLYKRVYPKFPDGGLTIE